MAVLSELEPKNVFAFFEEICGIPHGSGDTKRISDHLVAFAKERGLSYIQDEMNNVIIEKPGVNASEDAEPVILQGHIDMVCEKESGYDIDFSSEGLKLKLEDGIISAEGTTLGGDDGIAVAYMLALLDSKDITHPPLYCVFTVDEEIGMLGAAALDLSSVKSKLLINIDSEDEGVIMASCAGGATATCSLPIDRKNDSEGICCRLMVKGLTGGHSGVEIHKQRANSNQVLGRILYRISREASLDLISVEGGLKDNAIPRESVSFLSVKDKKSFDQISVDIEEMKLILKHEYHKTDPGLELVFEKVDDPSSPNPMDKASEDRVIALLRGLPNGIYRMSEEIEGLVQTSLNMGILKTDEKAVNASFSVRSSVGSEKDELIERLEAVTEALGGSVSVAGDYPAWEYKKDSRLRELMVDTYKELYKESPVIEAVHAGVECGLFAGQIEGLDAVSIGPEMKDIHTPAESMDAESVKRTWEYILKCLEKLAK